MKRLLFTSVGKVPTSIPGRRRDAARVTVERLSKMDQTGYFRYFARRLITANIFSFRCFLRAFDQVSSHARINVLTVSDLSSAKIRPLGSCTTIIRLSRYSMAKE